MRTETRADEKENIERNKQGEINDAHVGFRCTVLETFGLFLTHTVQVKAHDYCAVQSDHRATTELATTLTRQEFELRCEPKPRRKESLRDSVLVQETWTVLVHVAENKRIGATFTVHNLTANLG